MSEMSCVTRTMTTETSEQPSRRSMSLLPAASTSV